MATLAASTLTACDVPIGSPARDSQGKPVVESAADTQVQVIVRLRYDPPAGAKPGDAPYQSALLAVREAFLTAIEPFPHRVVRIYDTLPMVVLSIAPADRAAIEKLPLVAGVEEDRLNAPLAQ